MHYQQQNNNSSLTKRASGSIRASDLLIFRPFQTFKPNHRQNHTMKDSRSRPDADR
jgi:hypothetical protein